MHWYAWVLGPPETVLGFLVTYPKFWKWVDTWLVSPPPVRSSHPKAGLPPSGDYRHVPKPPKPYTWTSYSSGETYQVNHPRSFTNRCPQCGIHVGIQGYSGRCANCLYRGLPAKRALYELEGMPADEAKARYVEQLVHMGVATPEEAKRLMEM